MLYQVDKHFFYNLLFLELYFILQEKTYLKKCKNCGKYFLTTNSAVIYCDNVFEDNKTCREIGASKVFVRFMKHLLLISLIFQNRYLKQYTRIKNIIICIDI